MSDLSLVSIVHQIRNNLLLDDFTDFCFICCCSKRASSAYLRRSAVCREGTLNHSCRKFGFSTVEANSESPVKFSFFYKKKNRYLSLIRFSVIGGKKLGKNINCNSFESTENGNDTDISDHIVQFKIYKVV